MKGENLRIKEATMNKMPEKSRMMLMIWTYFLMVLIFALFLCSEMRASDNSNLGKEIDTPSQNIQEITPSKTENHPLERKVQEIRMEKTIQERMKLAVKNGSVKPTKLGMNKVAAEDTVSPSSHIDDVDKIFDDLY